jgi:hypothetical protein
MADSKIFFLEENASSLTAFIESAYDSEDILQSLLARYCDLLPGDQIDPDKPRRWLFVAREIGVPGEEDDSDRWSLDHLFLDQDAIPTFVECKRSSDTRGRREVVAQMLDYAANGVAYWSMDKLRQAAAETARSQSKSLDQEILKLLTTDDESAIERFWQQAEANLRGGRVRLIFVADETPRELRRLVEFLNEKMADVEVLAVEVKQYIGQAGKKALVPRVIGLTEAARTTKGAKPSARATNRLEFLAKCPAPAGSFFTYLLDRATQRGYIVGWGNVGFSLRVNVHDRPLSFLYGWPDGRFDFYSEYLLSREILPKDQEPELRKQLLSLGVFKASGELTFRAVVDDKTASSLPAICETLFDKIDEWSKAAPLPRDMGEGSESRPRS